MKYDVYTAITVLHRWCTVWMASRCWEPTSGPPTELFTLFRRAWQPTL